MRKSLAQAAAAFTGVCISFFAVLLVVRGIEYAVVRSRHTLPAGAGWLALRGVQSDAALTLWLAALLLLPILLLSIWSHRAARAVHRAFLVVVALSAVLLAQYFAVTFVPLGADLFGYSWSDAKRTVLAAGGSVLLALAALGLLGSLTWYVTGLPSKVRIPNFAVAAFLAVVASSVVFHGPLTLERRSFASDAGYFLAENKTVYFAAHTAAFIAQQREQTSGPPLSGFPLLHEASYDDVLGPRLSLGSQRPNIVFILVEGLGSDFAGDGAYYGGFMPFLDSLATQSLYWENFLSTSGRSFGAIPSLLGSLPFGSEGFMELGEGIPRHISLVSLLKDKGYATSYYSGTYGHFDNVDVFFEKEGIDRFVDESRFGAGYVKQPAGSNGFTWGYPDGELFRRGLELTGPPAGKPRLDFYATLTTHEPFIPPNTEAYLALFEQRLARLRVSDDRRAVYRQYSGIFSTLLYTDEAIKNFFNAYSRRADYANTIFIITGDHRVIPIPERARLDRHRVPLIIFSPMLRAPRKFSAVSSHLDVAPSVLALLHGSYGMVFPDSVSWLGSGLDTATAFRNVHTVAFMRTKNELEDYLDGPTFLSAGETFRLDSRLGLHPFEDSRARKQLEAKLKLFRKVNLFVTTGEHLYPGAIRDTVGARIAGSEDSLFMALGLNEKTSIAAFEVAQHLAWKGDYAKAQGVTRKLLRDTPNFHDARALLGRTYAWEHNYAEARRIFTELIRRAPEYVDGSVGLIDVEIWSGNGDAALAAANSALPRSPRSVELLLGKARALELLGRNTEALSALNALKAVDANNALAAGMRARLVRAH